MDGLVPKSSRGVVLLDLNDCGVCVTGIDIRK